MLPVAKQWCAFAGSAGPRTADQWYARATAAAAARQQAADSDRGGPRGG